MMGQSSQNYCYGSYSILSKKKLMYIFVHIIVILSDILNGRSRTINARPPAILY